MGRATPGHDDDPGRLDADEAVAFGALLLAWGGTWDIDHPGEQWRAARRDGTGQALTRASADGLGLALRISHTRSPR